MKLKAINPIDHDGKRFEPGKSFDVADEDQAQALIDCGAAEAVADKETAAEKKAREKAEALIDDKA